MTTENPRPFFVGDALSDERLQKLLAAIVESSVDAIMSETPDEMITSWNSAAERLYGYGRKEMLGQSTSVIIPPECREAHEQTLAQVCSGKRVGRYETARVAKDGKRIEINITVSPVRDSSGRIVGVSSIMHDIGSRREIEAQLAAYMEDLEKSHRALSDYTHTVSHDLKAPLRHIMQYCEILKEEASGRLSAEETKYIDRMIHNTKGLQRLVGDLLSYAQVMHTREEKHDLDVNHIVAETIDNLAPMIEETGATIHVGNLPYLSIYPLRMRQLLQNLIVNAIKYRGAAAPVIDIQCAEEPERFVFSVRDNGMGIAKEYHETIFKEFKRVFGAEKGEGSGLGLAICSKAVEMHGGRIWVESEAGKGSTFFFSIPKVQGAGRLSGGTLRSKAELPVGCGEAPVSLPRATTEAEISA